MQSQEEKERWRARWREGQTGWDQGGAHPALLRLMEHAEREGAMARGSLIFSAGCGRAHNEAKLASLGYHVTATDLSAEGITAAQGLYGQLEGLTLRVEDVFQIPEGEASRYDAVFDRAMLCALGPDQRPLYVKAVHDRLRSGGLFCGILFRDVSREKGPPFAVDELDAWALFHKQFTLVTAAVLKETPTTDTILEEWICIWRKGASEL